MLLSSAPESSEKSLHPISMPDCMQRLGLQGKGSFYFWVSSGRHPGKSNKMQRGGHCSRSPESESEEAEET